MRGLRSILERIPLVVYIDKNWEEESSTASILNAGRRSWSKRNNYQHGQWSGSVRRGIGKTAPASWPFQAEFIYTEIVTVGKAQENWGHELDVLYKRNDEIESRSLLKRLAIGWWSVLQRAEWRKQLVILVQFGSEEHRGPSHSTDCQDPRGGNPSYEGSR